MGSLSAKLGNLLKDTTDGSSVCMGSLLWKKVRSIQGPGAFA